MDRYDVIIVGSGPSGSSAAYHLAGAGHKVLLLDKKDFPREKVCGDGLTPRSVYWLREMGVLDQLRSHHRVNGVTLRTGACEPLHLDLAHVDSQYPNFGLVVPRAEMDALLHRSACEAGADFLSGVTVTQPVVRHGSGGVRAIGVRGARDGRPFEARAAFVVAADGARSAVALRMGLLRDDNRFKAIGVRAYFEGVEGLSDQLEFYLHTWLLPAYGWIFPMGDGLANVGTGVLCEYGKHTGGRLIEQFVKFTKTEAPIREQLARARQQGPPRAAILRLGMRGVTPAAGGVLCVGDAAALCNPYSGEGIDYALESGYLAADSIDLGAGNGWNVDQTCARYQRVLTETFGNYFGFARHMAHWFKKPQLLHHFMNAARGPRGTRAVVRHLSLTSEPPPVRPPA